MAELTEHEIEQAKMLEKMVIRRRGWDAMEAMREQSGLHSTDNHYNRAYLTALRRAMS